jgi:uncharacterized protein YrrD
MTVTRVDPTDEVVQLKIFQAQLDRLAELETEVNAWLKAQKNLRLDKVQVEPVGTDRVVVLVWHGMSLRNPRGVGFGEAVTARG